MQVIFSITALFAAVCHNVICYAVVMLKTHQMRRLDAPELGAGKNVPTAS